MEVRAHMDPCFTLIPGSSIGKNDRHSYNHGRASKLFFTQSRACRTTNKTEIQITVYRNVNSIHISEDSDQWHTIVITIMNLMAPQN
jgi:hypothetical protein